jgi:hypothetical protein
MLQSPAAYWQPIAVVSCSMLPPLLVLLRSGVLLEGSPCWHDKPYVSCCAAADLICEGFDHPDAQPTDLAHAARQMQSYAAHDRMLELATPEPTSSSSSIDDEEEEDKEEEPESALLLETYGAIESVKVSDALRRSFGRWEDMMYAMAAQRHRNDLLGGSDSDSDDDT